MASADELQYRWQFKQSLKPNAFGWKASKHAIRTIKNAYLEIKSMSTIDSALAAHGITELAELIWPTLQDIDSSSGNLAVNVHRCLHKMVPIFEKAELSIQDRNLLLERMYAAIEEDGVDFLSPLSERWGELCAGTVLADYWAGQLLPILEQCWSSEHGYFSGASACLSSLLHARRYTQLHQVMQICPIKIWHYGQYKFHAYIKEGKKSLAYRYGKQLAEQSPNLPEIELIYTALEELLLSSGLWQEAYYRFASRKYRLNHSLNCWRILKNRYPDIPEETIFRNLVKAAGPYHFKWLELALNHGFYEIAVSIVKYHRPDFQLISKTIGRLGNEYLDFKIEAFQLVIEYLEKSPPSEDKLQALEEFNRQLMLLEKKPRHAKIKEMSLPENS